MAAGMICETGETGENLRPSKLERRLLLNFNPVPIKAASGI
jgi:hypothetical protein